MCDRCSKTLDALLHGTKLPALTPIEPPNAIEIEFMLLYTLRGLLSTGELTTTQFSNDRVFSFPCADNKRANITITVVDKQYCNFCDNELINPRYQQTMHDDCKKKKQAQDVQQHEDAGTADADYNIPGATYA